MFSSVSALCGLLLYKAGEHAELFGRLSAEQSELVCISDAWPVEGEPKVGTSAEDVDASASVEVRVGIGFGPCGLLVLNKGKVVFAVAHDGTVDNLTCLDASWSACEQLQVDTQLGVGVEMIKIVHIEDFKAMGPELCHNHTGQDLSDSNLGGKGNKTLSDPRRRWKSLF